MSTPNVMPQRITVAAVKPPRSAVHPRQGRRAKSPSEATVALRAAKAANMRRRVVLAGNRDKYVRLLAVHLGKNDAAYVKALEAIGHVDVLILLGVTQNRWAN